MASIGTMHRHVPDRVNEVAAAMGLSSGDRIEASLRGLLARLNIFGLGFGDFNLRFELRRIGDTREIVTHFESLTDLHRQLL